MAGAINLIGLSVGMTAAVFIFSGYITNGVLMIIIRILIISTGLPPILKNKDGYGKPHHYCWRKP